MKTLLTIAILASLSGCAAQIAQREQMRAQERQDHNDKAEQKRDKDNAAVDTKFKEEQDKILKGRDIGLAVMDQTDPYPESTKLQVAQADHCRKTVIPNGPTDIKYNLCVSEIRSAEHQQQRDREKLLALRNDVEKAFNDDLKKLETQRDLDKSSNQRTYEASLMKPPVEHSYAGGYGASYAGIAPVNANPYNTPSPSLYMTPGPGTSIQTYGGPDMWSGRSTTPSGRAYTCFGAYGNVSCR